jgi:Family of unknown function (DUF5681)
MSVDPNSDSIGQEHRKRKMNPNSLLNLRPPFEKGNSPNPGGRPKGSKSIRDAYDKLKALTFEEFKSYEPETVVEAIAYRQIFNAIYHPKKDLAAAVEIADRTEGRAKQSIEVSNTGELERLIIRVQERILAQTGIELSREQAIEQIIEYRPELKDSLK